MKVTMILASDKATIANFLKVSAPRRRKLRHGGDPGWKAMQRKAKMYYKRNKAKLARKAKLYRKKNAARLAKRAEFLKHARPATVVAPPPAK